MSLSLDTIYQTLNTFFAAQFDTGAQESSFYLRFGQSRSGLTDDDFGTSPKGVETFSSLVNQIPIDKGDGMTIFFSSTNQIDRYYFYELLTPATVADPVDAPAFGRILQDAKNIWERDVKESNSGQMIQFHPSEVDPSEWTSKSFPIIDLSKPPPNTINITFDYCLVNIRRQWYFEPFIKDQTWYIEHKYKGQLSSRNVNTTTLTAIPISLIAIKNLNIQGDWSAEEISNFKTQFGPFLVTIGSDNKLVYDGIQAIGWLLEKLPLLPPNSAPNISTPCYSLIENAAKANWRTFSSPPGLVPPSYNPFVWMQSHSSNLGSAAIDLNVNLEDDDNYSALRTFPMSGVWGSISGVYSACTLIGKAKFTAQIGFQPIADFGGNFPPMNFGIQFQVRVYTQGFKNQKIVFNELKSIGSILMDVEADLFEWENEDVSIELFVCNGPTSIGALAYWVNPQIEYD